MKDPLKVYQIGGIDDIPALLKQMKEDGVESKMMKHILENQIFPKIIEDMMEDPNNFKTAMVTTNLSVDGYLVTCGQCGRQAKMPSKPPDDMVCVCPQCLKNL